MVWWQTLLAIWGIGAGATIPAVYEMADQDLTAGEVPLHWRLFWVLLAALAWPIAWVSLILYAIRRAAR